MADETSPTRIPLPTVPANLPPEVRKWALDLTRALDRAFSLRAGRVPISSVEGIVSFLDSGKGDLDALLAARQKLTGR